MASVTKQNVSVVMARTEHEGAAPVRAFLSVHDANEFAEECEAHHRKAPPAPETIDDTLENNAEFEAYWEKLRRWEKRHPAGVGNVACDSFGVACIPLVTGKSGNEQAGEMRSNVIAALKDLIAAVEQNTDCMTNQVDRAALDPIIEHASLVLSGLCEAELMFCQSPEQSELIEWFLPELALPDSDTTVLIISVGDTEAWPGYLDGDIWRGSDGMPILEDIAYWAHIPEGPAQ